ncbi:MAG: hypothetical protein OIN66_07580 [Candidatus Methanoperedens sp.]|nr:hypothetical protein [Candidatus Methanoperedens sp.]
MDGMIYSNEIRTDGAALVLCKDEEATIRVDWAREEGAIKSAEELAKKVKCENGVIVLHFPVIHVPDVIKSTEFIARGLYYSNRCKGANQEKQKEYAGKLADWCDKINMIYLPPTVLNIFARRTNYKIPILSINPLGVQVRFSCPDIFCNFKDIGNGIAALIIEKTNMNVYYDDIFSDKGNTLEETKDIARKEFTILKEFKANFEKSVLISLDGKPPMEAAKNLVAVSTIKEKDFLNKMGDGNFQVQTSYVLVFFCKKTKGVFFVGMGSYFPFNLYPFYTDVSDCSEDVFLGCENLYYELKDFISSLRHPMDNNDFKFFCLDVGPFFSFSREKYSYKDKIRELAKENYFGIISENPSAYLPKEMQKRNYFSEIEPNIFFGSGGSNFRLDI